MKIRLATFNDFSEYKHFLSRNCYNWMYHQEKVEDELPDKYELMTENELDLEIKRLRNSRLRGAGALVGYINEIIRYSSKCFEEDLADKKAKIYIIEDDEECIGVFRVTEGSKKCIRIVTWACMLQFQNMENLKEMLQLLLIQMGQGAKYTVCTHAVYGVQLLEKLGFEKNLTSVYRII